MQWLEGNVEVFVSTVRRAYLKKRSKKQMAVATLLLSTAAGLFGFASSQDERDQQAMSAEFTPALRKSVVSTWAGADIQMTTASPEGGR